MSKEKRGRKSSTEPEESKGRHRKGTLHGNPTEARGEKAEKKKKTKKSKGTSDALLGRAELSKIEGWSKEKRGLKGGEGGGNIAKRKKKR